MIRALLAILLLAACQPATIQPSPTPADSRPQAEPIAQASQSDSPAAAWLQESGYLFWVGDDAAGVHQDARTLDSDGLLSEPVVLPLPPRHPFAQTVVPSIGALHLLWLDADDTSPDQNRLFTALISPSLSVERGPTAISDAPTLRYSALARADGGFWAAWISGVNGQPGTRLLSIAPVDALGRPRPAQVAAENADHPALLRTSDNTVWLFWLDTDTGALRRALLEESEEGRLSAPEQLSSGVYVGIGDRIESLQALESASGDQAIVINLTRADQQAESWLWRQQGAAWSAPVRMSAQSGEALRQVQVISGSQVLAVTEAGIAAFAIADDSISQIALLVAGAQPLRPPGVAQRDGRLLLTWSQPDARGLFTQWIAERSAP